VELSNLNAGESALDSAKCNNRGSTIARQMGNPDPFVLNDNRHQPISLPCNGVIIGDFRARLIVNQHHMQPPRTMRAEFQCLLDIRRA
jgi:hypothetical protein